MRSSLVYPIVVGFVAATLTGPGAPIASAATEPAYLVEDLGTLPGDYASVAMGINRHGDVVGWSAGPAGTRAFVFTDAAGMSALPAPTGRPVTTARSVNASGAVVGTASAGGTDIGHAVRWQSGGVLDLGTLGTGTYSDGRGINATGVVVGSSYTSGGALLGIHAFRYDDASGLVDLTPTADTGHAEAINDVGQVAGWRNGRAFRLTGTTLLDLGVPAGFAQSFGMAINDAGQVAGHVVTGSGSLEQVFRYSDGVMSILGGMGEFNRALGINASGDVVGYGLPVLGLRQGFLYTDASGMRGLNQLIDPASGWFILGAGGINDAGQIAGWASGPSGQRAVRLTPTGLTAPTPPAAPSGLAAAVRSSGVRLSWTDNSDNEAGFRIQRAVGSRGSFAYLATVGPDRSGFTDTTAVVGKVYRYRVRAFNEAGPSAWSNTVRIRMRSMVPASAG